jgi:hypothetical protein
MLDTLDKEIVSTIEEINIKKHRCATYGDIVSLIGVENYSPETITREVRMLVEDGLVKRWKSLEVQKKATFFVVNL